MPEKYPGVLCLDINWCVFFWHTFLLEAEADRVGPCVDRAAHRCLERRHIPQDYSIASHRGPKLNRYAPPEVPGTCGEALEHPIPSPSTLYYYVGSTCYQGGQGSKHPGLIKPTTRACAEGDDDFPVNARYYSHFQSAVMN